MKIHLPNQFFVFISDTGLASISFSGRSDAYIDDLSFYYAGEAVPEPSTILLLGLGLLGLILRQRQSL